MELLDSLVSSPDPSARASFPGGAVLTRRYDLLTPADAPAALPPTPLPVPGTSRLPGFTITCSEPGAAQTVWNQPDRFSLRFDLIRSGLCVRSRRTGDRMQLPGGSRSLKRLMIDRKIPASLRGALPVLAAADGIAAVAGVGADQRFLAQPGELAVEIKIEKEDETYDE